MLLLKDENDLILDPQGFEDEMGNTIDACCFCRRFEFSRVSHLDEEIPHRFDDDRSRGAAVRAESSLFKSILL